MRLTSATALYQHALRGSGYAVRQPNIPPPFALIHPQYDVGFSRRMINWSVEQQKTRPQLRDWNGVPIQEQGDTHVGRVAAVAAGLIVDE